MQTITTFRNHLAAPVGTRRGPPLVRGPQFENRCAKRRGAVAIGAGASSVDVEKADVPPADDTQPPRTYGVRASMPGVV